MNRAHENGGGKAFGIYCVMSRVLVLIGFLALFALAAYGLNTYFGSKMVYLVFTLTYTLLLLSGVSQSRSPGYLFLTIFMWLGFWLKATVHLIYDYPFGEPIGNFSNAMESWDEVLVVSTVAGISVMFANGVYKVFPKAISIFGYRKLSFELNRYKNWRKSLWIFAILLSFGINFLNLKLSILRIGIPPATILVWPLNSVISWLLGYGMVMIVATLIWWDILLKREIGLQVYVIFIEAILSSITMLSRSVFLFHSIPQIFAIYKIRKSRANILKSININFVMLGGVIVVAFVLSIFYVSVTRDAEYSGVKSDVNTTEDSLVYGVATLAPLIIDRWVGLEGVMAVSSYPNKGSELFMEMLSEVRHIGIPTKYQEISNASYQFMEADQDFATLPGAVAFFYFWGSLWVVWIGMIVVVFFIFLSERLAFSLTKNPLLVSWTGFTAANTVAQFGITPVQTVIPYLLIFCGFIGIHFLEKRILRY